MNYDVMEKLLSEQEEKYHQYAFSRWVKCLEYTLRYDCCFHCDSFLKKKDGSVTELSAGQAFNRMMGDPDKEVRQRLFTAWEKAWSGKASIFSRHPKSLGWVPFI